MGIACMRRQVSNIYCHQCLPRNDFAPVTPRPWDEYHVEISAMEELM
jgi:hypothetical protein